MKLVEPGLRPRLQLHAPARVSRTPLRGLSFHQLPTHPPGVVPGRVLVSKRPGSHAVVPVVHVPFPVVVAETRVNRFHAGPFSERNVQNRVAKPDLQLAGSPTERSSRPCMMVGNIAEKNEQRDCSPDERDGDDRKYILRRAEETSHMLEQFSHLRRLSAWAATTGNKVLAQGSAAELWLLNPAPVPLCKERAKASCALSYPVPGSRASCAEGPPTLPSEGEPCQATSSSQATGEPWSDTGQGGAGRRLTPAQAVRAC